MTGIVNDGSRFGPLYLAKDIVSAMLLRAGKGDVQSHGSIRCAGWPQSQAWRSAFPVGETESVLRAVLRKEGLRLVCFVSQAADGTAQDHRCERL